MKKRIRAAAIIFKDNKLITVYREKVIDGKLIKYYVIPGGGKEENEELLDAIKREVMEEVGIEISLTNDFFYFENEKAEEYFYLADYVSGNIGSGAGEEFTNRDKEKYGTYEIKLVEKEKIKDINLLPKEIKEFILKNYVK